MACATDAAAHIARVQANVDVCCDPPNNGFGCDYTGLPNGRFNETSGALADVIPFTHVGGWCVTSTCSVHMFTLDIVGGVRRACTSLVTSHSVCFSSGLRC